MRAGACLCALAIGLGMVGCSTFGKKSQGTQPSGVPQAPPPNWPPSTAIPDAGSARGPLPGASGLLAGRVIDSYDRKPPPTFIQVVSAGQGEGKPAPIEVAADANGYFTIMGLQTGQHYQLIARTKEGEAKMMGSIWATPPNPRLLIYMNEDLATPNTPPPPGEPKVPGVKGADPSKTSNIPGPSARAVDLGAPIRSGGQPPGATDQGNVVTPVGVHPDRMAAVNRGVGNAIPATIPGQAAQDRGVGMGTPIAQGYAAQTPSLQVPSCLLNGRQLENFALYDLSGKPWEYRHHQGKLVLLDFWGTWCAPCRSAIHHLKILQSQYGSRGLEIVGIDYEYPCTFQEHVRKVQGLRDAMGINYRLLLGGSMDSCPVKAQFGVTCFPTLVLLDENNRIIWHKTGLDGEHLQELTVLLKQRLGSR